jgi:hypothetical protein
MEKQSTHPVTALVGRLAWMLLGPAALFMSAMAIARRDGWLTAPDVTFMAALGIMVLGRWAEYWAGDARTADWEPVTPAHLRRYTVVVLVGGAGIWAAINLWVNA